jgi:hypothetical protein
MDEKSRPPQAEDDPTDEHEALEFDGTHTEVLDDTYRFRVVATSENSAGGIDRDELGRARWKWIAEGTAPAGETDKTFDHLKALDQDGLAVDGAAPDPAPQPLRKVGHNPYDTGPSEKPKPKK